MYPLCPRCFPTRRSVKRTEGVVHRFQEARAEVAVGAFGGTRTSPRPPARSPEGGWGLACRLLTFPRLQGPWLRGEPPSPLSVGGRWLRSTVRATSDRRTRAGTVFPICHRLPISAGRVARAAGRRIFGSGSLRCAAFEGGSLGVFQRDLDASGDASGRHRRSFGRAR